MRTLRAVLGELAGLFVDDGMLALGLMLWCAVIGIGASLRPEFARLGALLLFAGCAVILLANVTTAARRVRRG